ncbi:hypothetical protein B0H15DRAFT_850764 [Mycena belliarum]|uniref:Uncharacterized protein n=1 Tax=Mycena belliarum TaxID=1033014 RepID=A0AAD6U047_9AGAR|nr:hypothetical protein B0H15DRAFT_850764 [Mycena belliae]
MPPRPILKALLDPVPIPSLPDSFPPNPLPFAGCSLRVMFTPHVHFPATPMLTLTAETHSPGSYDRAPIAVSPNSCALPERGGRVYPTPSGSGSVSASSPATAKGSYFHPRAFEACDPEPVPALLPDLSLSSETDEWDECASPKPTSPEPRVAVRMQGTPYPTPIPSTHSQEEFDHAMSFLPYPPALTRDPEKRPGRRSSPAPMRSRPRGRPRSSVFKEPGTDSEGCLGGF